MFFIWHSRIGDRNEIRAQKTGRKTGEEKKNELRRKEKYMVLESPKILSCPTLLSKYEQTSMTRNSVS